MGSLSAEEITDLREPIRRLCADRFDRAAVRETGHPMTLDRDGWQALADVGVLGALAPAELGGVELGFATVASLFEECGYGLAPGPLVYSALAATVLAGVASGDVLVSGALIGSEPLLIEHGTEADLILLVGEQLEVFPTDSVLAVPVESIDPLTPLARITRPLDRPGERLGDAGLAPMWRAGGACLAASYLVGLSRLALALGVTHATDRIQFGRPIAGFQAVKHLLADILVGIERAAAAVAYAADQLDAGKPAAQRACASAKVLAGEAAMRAAKNCIQVHGGMGYAWETDPHLLWKRAMIYNRSFGSPDDHAEAIAATLAVTK
ncbi:MAG: acyl-CoA dehydrogenase family protein [Solirubrobacteraceae bacterium]